MKALDKSSFEKYYYILRENKEARHGEKAGTQRSEKDGKYAGLIHLHRLRRTREVALKLKSKKKLNIVENREEERKRGR